MERFLVETKIFDASRKAIQLDRSDGWLEQAAIAAAQHEKNAAAREELLANPTAFLDDRGWLGLLNTTRALAPRASPILSTDATPLEDRAIKVRPSKSHASSDWNRAPPVPAGKASTTTEIDLIARERATLSHFALEKLLADFVKARGFAPRYNQNIDLHFETKSGSVLVEIKSCTDTNYHSQLRKAVSQLFEYRFVYRKLFKTNLTMLLLMETAPPKEKSWLVDYAYSLGIVVAWTAPRRKAIVTTCTLPESLAGLVAAVGK